MSTQIDIYNRALSYLDLSQRVQSLTENTPTAGYCNTFWDPARKMILEQCYWSFATRAAALALLLDQGVLPQANVIYPGWRYNYAKPNEALKVQAVTTWYGIRANPYLSYWWLPVSQGTSIGMPGPFRPPWKEALDYTNTANPGQSIDILTDQDGAWAIYTTDPPNIAVCTEVFADCVSWKLATMVSGPVSASAKAKENAIKMADLSLSRALAQNLNEEQPDPYPESPSTLSRL